MRSARAHLRNEGEANLHRLRLAGTRFARDEDRLRAIVTHHRVVRLVDEGVNVRRQLRARAALVLGTDALPDAASILERIDGDDDITNIRVHELRLRAFVATSAVRA